MIFLQGSTLAAELRDYFNKKPLISEGLLDSFVTIQVVASAIPSGASYDYDNMDHSAVHVAILSSKRFTCKRIPRESIILMRCYGFLLFGAIFFSAAISVAMSRLPTGLLDLRDLPMVPPHALQQSIDGRLGLFKLRILQNVAEQSAHFGVELDNHVATPDRVGIRDIEGGFVTLRMILPLLDGTGINNCLLFVHFKLQED